MIMTDDQEKALDYLLSSESGRKLFWSAALAALLMKVFKIGEDA